MQYSDVFRYADEDQSDFILTNVMPKKYVDHELRRLCYDTEREMRIRLQLIQTNRDDEKEYDKLRGEILYKHANKRVGAFIKSQQVTPKEKSQLIARLYEQQGLGLPWGRQFFRNPLSHSPNEGQSIFS